MSVSIRRLLPADAETFQQVRERAVAEHPEAFLSSSAEEESRSLDVVRERLGGANGSVVLGAFDGAALVGTCGVYRAPREKVPHKCMVWGMYVAPEARRRGIGRDMLRAAVAHARTVPGVTTLDISVNVANGGARTLYHAEGFVPWGVEPDAFRVAGAPQDEEHMRMEL